MFIAGWWAPQPNIERFEIPHWASSLPLNQFYSFNQVGEVIKLLDTMPSATSSAGLRLLADFNTGCRCRIISWGAKLIGENLSDKDETLRRYLREEEDSDDADLS